MSFFHTIFLSEISAGNELLLLGGRVVFLLLLGGSDGDGAVGALLKIQRPAFDWHNMCPESGRLQRLRHCADNPLDLSWKRARSPMAAVSL